MKRKFMLAFGFFTLTTLALILSGCGGQPGPETIDLSNPAIYTRSAYPDFKLNMEIKSIGVDPAGTMKTFVLFYDIANQSEPLAQHIMMAGQGASGTVEIVILDDQVLTVNPGSGCSVFPVSAMEGQRPEDTIPKISTLLAGEVKRLKTGVRVEGIVTDQYEITSANMTNPGSSATPRITEGSVYIARDGGYVARVELDGLVNSGQNGFDPNVESQMTLSYTFIPVASGSLEISAPAECQEQLTGGGPYPLMDDATDLVFTQDAMYYKVNVPIEEALTFYRARMIEKGWSLTNDTGNEAVSLATLEFNKGSETVLVNVASEAEGVSVTVNKK
jgi:hypothetical protein